MPKAHRQSQKRDERSTIKNSRDVAQQPDRAIERREDGRVETVDLRLHREKVPLTVDQHRKSNQQEQQRTTHRDR